MRKITLTIALLAALAPAAPAQLTQEQKEADFRFLAGVYNKYYAPYEWKQTLFGFNMLDIQPWLAKVAASKSDLEFYDICSEYVASLRDSHVYYAIPSAFSARLGFGVDIYDGKLLIESITRSLLPATSFPFETGDELVSVDGKDMETLLSELARYGMQGNDTATRRVTAARITTRPQTLIARASELGDSAEVVIRRQNGALETYTIPWVKTGVPIEVGPVLSPRATKSPRAARSYQRGDYLAPLRELQHSGVSGMEGVLNYGSRTPLFALPAGFVQRLGRNSSDFFYSGSFQAGGYTIGYIRIPHYRATETSLEQFEEEIAWFQQNTDGLIVDEMRNTGGNLCFGQEIAARLIPYPFQATGFAIRPFWGRVASFYYALLDARLWGADQWVIDLYEALYKELALSYSENRALTGPLPLCSPSLDQQPATDVDGNIIAYTKPVMMLIDEFSTSTADSVAAMFQDAGRGILFGMRSNGAGGNNTSFDAGAYSEGEAGVTIAIQTRRSPVATPDFPTSIYIENVGVRPDIQNDYMTRDNLLQRGKPFVDAFTAAMVEHIKSKM